MHNYEKNIHDVLGVFVDNTNALRTIAREENMLFWGPPVVAIFRPGADVTKSIMIFLRSGFERLVAFLQSENYGPRGGHLERREVRQHGELPDERSHPPQLQIQQVSSEELSYLGTPSLESYVVETSMTTYGAHFMTWRHAVCVCPALLADGKSIALTVRPNVNPLSELRGIEREVKLAHQQGYMLPFRDDIAWGLGEVTVERTLGDGYCQVIEFDGDKPMRKIENRESHNLSCDGSWKFSFARRIYGDAFRFWDNGKEMIALHRVQD